MGTLIHLYTDERYYGKMFRGQDMQNITLQEFRSKHVITMDAHDSFVAQQYGASYDLTSPAIAKELSDNIARYRKNNPIKDNYNPDELLFSQQDLATFIDETSSVNLQALVEHIKTKSTANQLGISTDEIIKD
ncbi:MAG: hypothetical protein FWE16_06135 [Firmicutes bacterium]|nr:hypothetical protein [Bacillota bacterium]